MTLDLEKLACVPTAIKKADFNPNASLEYGLTIDHIQSAMEDFRKLLGGINGQINSNGMERLESMLMPANFSSIVGEFMISTIPRYSSGLAKNLYHNGHPDLLPDGEFTGNAAQHVQKGIEVKASRYTRGWQGHNPEDTWLMVFVFDSNRPGDLNRGRPIQPKPFRFRRVLGARLKESDWRFSGRSGTSRRTITASVTKDGYRKMINNWIYWAD